MNAMDRALAGRPRFRRRCVLGAGSGKSFAVHAFLDPRSCPTGRDPVCKSERSAAALPNATVRHHIERVLR